MVVMMPPQRRGPRTHTQPQTYDTRHQHNAHTTHHKRTTNNTHTLFFKQAHYKDSYMPIVDAKLPMKNKAQLQALIGSVVALYAAVLCKGDGALFACVCVCWLCWWWEARCLSITVRALKPSSQTKHAQKKNSNSDQGDGRAQEAAARHAQV